MSRLLKVLVGWWCLTTVAFGADPSELLEKSSRIVFLGDSITYSGHYVTCVEAWMATRRPSNKRTVINLGLSSETVSGRRPATAFIPTWL